MLEKHGFTKMAVSQLIMVKIWHAQCFGPNLSIVKMASRATRHTRDDVTRASDTIKLKLTQLTLPVTSFLWVVGCDVFLATI